MADFSALKTAIQTYIKQNGNEEITGEILQEILLSVVTTLGDSAINDLITALSNEVAARQNADGTLQQNIDNEATARNNADTALGGRIDDEAIARANADTALQTAINLINSYIPAQASSSNQLADKDFVNSSIATATATFRGTYNVVTDLELSYNATNAQIQAALATKMAELSIIPDNNDYAFVQRPTSDATPTQIENTSKYKFNGSAWAFEYVLNNSGFTAAQWAAINSGATLELIGKLSALPTNAQLIELLNDKVSWTDNGAYDVTANNSGATFASLNAILNSDNLATLIPTDIRRGGMSIKYVQTSNNKYVQHHYMGTETTGSPNPFLNINNWCQIASIEQTRFENGGLNFKMYQGFTKLDGTIQDNTKRITTGPISCPKAPFYIQVNEGYVAYLGHGDAANSFTDDGIIINDGGVYEFNIECSYIYINLYSSRGVTPTDSTGFIVYTKDSLQATKQDKLTFDTTPTENSTNPVTSGGIKTAIDTVTNTVNLVDAKAEVNRKTLNEPVITSAGNLNSRNYKVTNGQRVADSDYQLQWVDVTVHKGEMAIVHACAGNDIQVISYYQTGYYHPLVYGSDASKWKDYYYLADADTNIKVCSKKSTATDSLTLDVISFADNYDGLSSLQERVIDAFVQQLSSESLVLSWDELYNNHGDFSVGDSSVVTAPNNATYKIIKVNSGDSIYVNTGTTVYAFLKSYYPFELSKEFTPTPNFVDGVTAFSVFTGESTITVPSDANYLMIQNTIADGTSVKPTSLKINGYDVLKGLKKSGYVESSEPITIVLKGSTRTFSQFFLRKDKKYKITFSSDNFVVPAGKYLNIFLGAGGSLTNGWLIASTAGIVNVPSDITFTPSEDTYLRILHNISDGGYLRLDIAEVDYYIDNLIKDNIRLYEQFNTMKSWHIENMLLGGHHIGEVDDSNTYIVSHDFDEKGNCYVGAFTSKTLSGESGGGTPDWIPVLITFNMASPEETNETHVAMRIDEQVYQDNPNYTLGYAQMVVAKRINTTTVRLVASISSASSLRMVYKDYNIENKTFETYAHDCTITDGTNTYVLNSDNAEQITTAFNIATFGSIPWVAIPANPIKIGDYFYAGLTIYGYSHTLCRSTDLANWEIVSDIPVPYCSDESCLAYMSGRIYVALVGNKTRRANGDFDKMLYYDLETQQWSQPIDLGYYGHDIIAIECMDGKVYSLHTNLGYNSETDTATRDTNYVDGVPVMRSIKTLFVHDPELNLINKTKMILQRPIVTTHFGVRNGVMYAFVGSNPRGLADADGRNNYLFSYLDTRFLSI